jgi:hypothetical protein
MALFSFMLIELKITWLCIQTIIDSGLQNREVLTFVDQFKALPFTATGAPPTARRIRILPMSQYA